VIVMMYGLRRDWVVFEELLGQDELPWSNAVLVGSVATGEHRAESAVKHSMPATYSTFINGLSRWYRVQHSLQTAALHDWLDSISN
jgi:hypothetical protein